MAEPKVTDLSALRWEQDAPDHWHADLDEHITIGVWPSRGSTWHWDVFDRRIDPDEPVREGDANTQEAAQTAAEEAARG